MSATNSELDAKILALDAKRDNEKKDHELRTIGITVTDFGDIEQAPVKKHLIRNFLGAGELSCCFGSPGCGKSALATDLAGHVAWGQDWFGRRVMPGGVIFLAAERAALVKRRLAAFRLYHGIADLPLKVFSGSIDLRTNRTQAHGIVNYIQRWRDEEGVETKLIIGDTTSKLLFGGDENSPKDMGGFINNVSHIQEGSGAHFLLVHHIPHEQNRMRGHGPTIRAENNAGIRTATIEKNNDGEEGDQITFNLESFDLGSDPETGEVTTAPIVRPTEATSRTTTAEPRLRRLTKNQQTMYSFLHDAGRNGLTTDEWNAIARANDIGTKRKADLVDLRSALKAKGLVREFNDRWTAVTD